MVDLPEGGKVLLARPSIFNKCIHGRDPFSIIERTLFDITQVLSDCILSRLSILPIGKWMKLHLS